MNAIASICIYLLSLGIVVTILTLVAKLNTVNGSFLQPFPQKSEPGKADMRSKADV